MRDAHSQENPEIKFVVRLEPLNAHVKTLLLAANLPFRVEVR